MYSTICSNEFKNKSRSGVLKMSLKTESYPDGLHEFRILVRDRNILGEVVVLEGQVLHVAFPGDRVEVLEIKQFGLNENLKISRSRV